jgi:hypothetical protein
MRAHLRAGCGPELAFRRLGPANGLAWTAASNFGVGCKSRPCKLHVVFSDQADSTWLAVKTRGRSLGLRWFGCRADGWFYWISVEHRQNPHRAAAGAAQFSGSCHNRRVHGRQPSITTRTYTSSSTTWKAGISSFRLAYRKPSSLLGNKVRQAPELWYAYSRFAGPRPNRNSQFPCCETRPPASISYESRVYRPHNRNSSTRCNGDRRPGNPGGEMY